MSETLQEILHKLKHLDDEMPPEEFDPAALVGDVKDKIDAIKWRLDTWEARAEVLESWIKDLRASQTSVLRKKESLSEYLRQQMVAHGFDKLPGNLFRAQLQKSSPTLQIDLEPGPAEMEAYPGLITETTIRKWDREEVKARLAAGATLSFARVTNSRHLRFYTANKSPSKAGE